MRAVAPNPALVVEKLHYFGHELTAHKSSLNQSQVLTRAEASPPANHNGKPRAIYSDPTKEMEVALPRCFHPAAFTESL